MKSIYKRSKKLLFSILILIISFNGFGQTNSVDTIQMKKAKVNFIKFVGGDFIGGNAASATGYLGQNLSGSSKYFDFYGGYGYGPGWKLSLGVGCHSDLRKRFAFFLATELNYCFKHKESFLKSNDETWKYRASGALAVNYGGGLVWNPKVWDDPDVIVGPFVKIGYRQQILSDCSISPVDASKSDPSDIDDVYYKSFKSRLYWNFGIKITFVQK